MPKAQSEPTLLAELKPGCTVSVLAVILGAYGPTRYTRANAGAGEGPGYYAHLTLADASSPLGISLKFFGAAVITAAAALPPLVPLLFSNLSTTRDGALLWNASAALRSAADPAPPPSPQLAALTAWVDSGALGDLPAAARAGQVAPPLIAPPVLRPVPARPSDQSTRRGIKRGPLPSAASSPLENERVPPSNSRVVRQTRRRIGAHNVPRPQLRSATSLAAVAATGECCLVIVDVLEVRVPQPPSHRALPYISGSTIQALVSIPERPAALPAASPLYSQPLMLLLRAPGSEAAWAMASGDAAARVLGGVSAERALSDKDAATRAALMLADLVQEGGPFQALVAPREGNGCKLEVVDFFV